MRLMALTCALSLVSAAVLADTVTVVAGRPGLPVSAACKLRLADYDKLLKMLAQETAESAYPGPKSAMLLQSEQQSFMSLGQSMELSSCGGRPLPLSPGPYLLAAMKCERAKRAPKAPPTPVACERENWKPYPEV